jgi:hypothetical protein
MTDFSDLNQANQPGQRQRRRSRYERPRRPISWIGLFFGIFLGIGGGIFFAWNIAPAEEFDTEPWQLNRADQANYAIAAVLSYAQDGDLGLAIQQLNTMRPSVDPIQFVADITCDLARSGYVSSSSGLNAIRAAMRFYQLQGRTGCADELIPPLPEVAATEDLIIAASPTLPPPPTKTATPIGTAELTPSPSAPVVEATAVEQIGFQIVRNEAFCDPLFSGVIEVYVQDSSGAPRPGERVRVQWDDGQSIFFTGLNRLRGLDYADFEMEAGKGYVIDMPGQSNPSTTEIVAAPCESASGPAMRSYRVVFRPTF